MRKKSRVPASDPSLEKERTLVEELKAAFNISKVKKTIALGTEVFTAVAPFLEKPNWWNGVKAAFAIGKVFVDEVELWSEDYFAGDEWNLPYSRDFNQTIIKVITGYPYETIRTSDENNIIRIVDVEGIKCGYIMNTKLSAIDNIYVETARLQDARNVIKRLLWEQFKDANLVMRQNKRLVLHDDESRVLFELDDAFHSMPSRRASNYAAYLKRCIDANVSRSVMLYGPPGTGKSTMARTIVTELKMRSFRIRVEDVAGLESSTLFEAISIFEPDAIILDDFDRAHAQAQLLETLEFFQRHVKLVIATVNDRNSLDEAILRPGRFDELLLINEMEPEVIEAVLGPELKDAMKSVKDWPIAFIQEYVKRRRFMSAEEAEASTKELADRVKRLEKYKDVDEVERMHRLTRKHLKMTKVEIEEDDEEDGPDTDPPDPNYNLDKDVEIVKVSHDEVEEVERSFDRK